MATQEKDGTTTKRIDGALTYADPTGPIGRNRAQLRKFLDRLIVEFVTMGIVMFYVSGALPPTRRMAGCHPPAPRRSPGHSPRPHRHGRQPVLRPVRRCC